MATKKSKPGQAGEGDTDGARAGGVAVGGVGSGMMPSVVWQEFMTRFVRKEPQ
jgi:hypothetical protein